MAATVTHAQAIVAGLTGSRLDTEQMIDALQQGGAGPLSRPDPADGHSRYFLHDHAGTLDYAWSHHGGTPTRALEYIASHPDLIAAFGADPEAGRLHFERNGSVEERPIALTPRLPRLVRRSARRVRWRWLCRAAAHDIGAGATEGRVASFAGLDYIASYGDLIAAFGAQADAGVTHFVANGFTEGRARDLFDAAGYLANYADLRAAFGADEEAATRHYITNGLFEGRTDETGAASADFLI